MVGLGEHINDNELLWLETFGLHIRFDSGRLLLVHLPYTRPTPHEYIIALNACKCVPSALAFHSGHLTSVSLIISVPQINC